MSDNKKREQRLTRRDFLKTGLLTAGTAATVGAASRAPALRPRATGQQQDDEHEDLHASFGASGTVDHDANGFDPMEILTDFDTGTVSQLDDGQTLREYEFFALNKEIEVAPGVYFPGWVYGSTTSGPSRRTGSIVGTVPGPTIRCVEGDRIRLHFTNASDHPHTVHFHGIHSAYMDGVPSVGRGDIHPGESFTYEFDAVPMGCHLYHCHSLPLKRHIHKGLYGGFIVDPDPEKYSGREREIAKTRHHQYPENEDVHEMVMVMNGFDTNFDGDNEIYAANTIAFAYQHRPIQIRRDQLQRVYLINATEFDPINSFHLHANFFDYYDHGTTLEPTLKTVDTIMQCQAQRGILEFSFAGFEPGRYMFHAHQSEFAELGWMSFFDVVE